MGTLKSFDFQEFDFAKFVVLNYDISNYYNNIDRELLFEYVHKSFSKVVQNQRKKYVVLFRKIRPTKNCATSSRRKTLTLPNKTHSVQW